MAHKDKDDSFQLKGPITEMAGGKLSANEVINNLLSAKRWRILGLDSSLSTGKVETVNDSSKIEGFSQGADQCFSTCVVAWAAMQEGMSINEMNNIKDALHGKVGDLGGTIVILGQVCRNGKKLAENIVETIDIGMSEEDLHSADLEVRHTAEGEIKAGEREGNLLKMGGGLVLQDGAHFRLVFMEKDAIVKIFDPLGGRVLTITSSEIFDYVSPRNETTDKGTILELNPPSDFIIT